MKTMTNTRRCQRGDENDEDEDKFRNDDVHTGICDNRNKVNVEEDGERDDTNDGNNTWQKESKRRP